MLNSFYYLNFKQEQVRKMPSDVTKEKTYPLHKVIRCRNIHKMKILLSSTKDLNEKNELGYPPLLYACEQPNNDEMLDLLLAEKNINPLVKDNDGQNALHLLAFHGKLIWIQKIFELFPNFPVDEVNLKGTTALMMAAKMDHVDIIQYLYKKGAKVNHKNDKNYSALLYAANNGYTKSTKQLLELGAEIDAQDDRKCTPLMKCSSWNFPETCKILIENGATVDKKDSFGNTALIVANRRGYIKVAEILLQNEANPNMVTDTEYLSYTPVVTACKNNNIDMLKLLLKYGGNVNFPGNYSHALFQCIKTGFVEGVRILIKAKVDLSARHPQSKKTPLEQARRTKQSLIADLIQRSL